MMHAKIRTGARPGMCPSGGLHPLWQSLLAAGLILLLAGCGSTVQAGCPGGKNTSPPTVTSGLVSIATDHTVYANTKVIHVAFTNHLRTTMYVRSLYVGCPIFAFEERVQDQWHWVNLQCQRKFGDIIPGPSAQHFMPGASDTEPIPASMVQPGIYRLMLTYYTLTTRGYTTTYSEPFCICP
jgi:hypothetical protein